MSKFSHIDTWIFDLDDTLYPPSAFSKHMNDNIHNTLAKHLKMDVDNSKQYCKNLVKKYGGVPFTGLNKESEINMHDFISEAFDLDFSLIDRNIEIKAKLENLNGKKVVFTNSPNQHAKNVLNRLDYSHIFNNIYDVTMFDFDSKPNIAPYNYVLEDLNVNPKNCIMVEDSLKNLKTAKSLGMTTVYIHGNEKDDESIADYRYDSLLEFLNDIN